MLATSETDGRGGTQVLGGDENLERIGARAAASNLPDEAGGVIRRFGAEVAGLPTLAVAVAERLGRPRLAQRLRRRRRADRLPRARPGRSRPSRSPTLLAGKVDPALLRGRVVVIGASAPTLHDQHATPQGRELMSGPEVQANAIWTALHGLPLTAAPAWLDALLILLAAASVPLLALRVRGTVAALAAPALGVAYVAVAQFVFEHGTVLAAGRPARRAGARLRRDRGGQQPARERRAPADRGGQRPARGAGPRAHAASCARPSWRSSSASARPSSRATRRPASTSSGSRACATSSRWRPG